MSHDRRRITKRATTETETTVVSILLRRMECNYYYYRYNLLWVARLLNCVVKIVGDSLKSVNIGHHLRSTFVSSFAIQISSASLFICVPLMMESMLSLDTLDQTRIHTQGALNLQLSIFHDFQCVKWLSGCQIVRSYRTLMHINSNSI